MPTALGIETRVGPVAIANGRFGHRPHCIYRGFCLQGCKVNAKASPLITHIPDALGARGGDSGSRHGLPRRRRRGWSRQRRHLLHPWRRALPAGPNGGRGRVLHRDVPAFSSCPPRRDSPTVCATTTDRWVAT